LIQIKAHALLAPDLCVMPSHPLSKDVVLVIAVKLAIVIAAALFVFGPKQLPRIDAGSIETRLIGAVNVGQKRTETSP
jgi:hypothetical protein